MRRTRHNDENFVLPRKRISNQYQEHQKKSSLCKITPNVMWLIFLLSGSFYTGRLFGNHVMINISRKECNSRETKQDTKPMEPKRSNPQKHDIAKDTTMKKHDAIKFPSGLSKLVTKIATTNKEGFINEHDYGMFSPPRRGTLDVVLLYSNEKAFPSAEKVDRTSTVPGVTDAKDATANCDVMNVVMTNPRRGVKQCLAFVHNYDTFHVQRWMRFSPNEPHEPVGRGMQANGKDQFIPPSKSTISKHWKFLSIYLNTVDDMLKRLKPMTKAIAIDNTIIVMVCNFGQSSLLMNFVCSCKAKGFDIGNLLVFATDEETMKIAQALGVSAFYDEANFKSLPSEASRVYGGRVFAQMMWAKVISVQLISMLGYDILFQDLDIVWIKPPLQFFHNKTNPLKHFDILFQDDGARSMRYAPYSANSGFYYVRQSDKTQYLLTSLLYSGDLIQATGSHQQALAVLLGEHSSLYGLKVKTLDKNDFPGGAQYHKDLQFMKSFTSNRTHPFMFHMSWTDNKDNKLLFFKQMGMWYVKDQCMHKKALDVLKENQEYVDENSAFSKACCSMEPIITCHYRDKPSIIPCNTSPTIDKNGKPYWTDS